MAPQQHRTPKKNIKEHYDQMAQITGIDAANLRRFNSWSNQIFDGKMGLDDLSWVGKNEERIVRWIKENEASGKHKPSSTKTHYSALAVWFRETAKKLSAKSKLRNVYADKQKKYSDLSKDINKGIVQEQQNQRLKFNETYLPFPEVLKIKDRLETEFKADRMNKEKNLQYLIFAINTMQPPLRTETLNMRIEPKQDPNIKHRDYAYKTDDGIWHWWIGKVIKKQKEVNFSIDLSPDLSRIIDSSLKYYPRKWLLASWTKKSKGDNPLPYSTYSRWLLGFSLGQSAFRKSYVTYWRKIHPRATINEKKELARLMRHNSDTADLYYNKLDSDDRFDAIFDVKLDEMKERERKIEQEQQREEPEAVPNYQRMRPGPKPKYASTKDYFKAYRAVNAERMREYARKHYQTNKTRAKAHKYVRKLNLPENTKDKILHPSQRLIEEYKLENPHGQWISRI